jgi:hypothetical protein
VAWFGVLYATTMVSMSAWYVKETTKDTWLVEKEANPLAKPLPFLSDQDWCAQLATESFSSLGPSERTATADKKFEELRSLAGSLGYDEDTLRTWLHETAINFQRYPVRTFTYGGIGDSEKRTYRDLNASGFPAPARIRLFWKHLLSSEILGFGLIVTVLAAMPLLLMVGIVQAFREPTLLWKWKTLIGSLLFIAIVEGLVIRQTLNNPVRLGLFRFSNYFPDVRARYLDLRYRPCLPRPGHEAGLLAAMESLCRGHG